MDYCMYSGTVVHTRSLGEVLIEPDRCIVVDKSTGRICEIQNKSEWSGLVQKYELSPGSIVEATETQFFIPGLVDTHMHAPQYKFAGTATDMPLLKWLDQYTFPAETQMQDSTMAEDVYNKCIQRVMSHGTTTAMIYGTIHLQPNKSLADICEKRRMRSLIGKVCMDRNSPDDYIETTADSISETEAFIKYVQAKKCSYLYPVVTPRFVPTCTSEALAGLSELASKYDLHITSHMSETNDQVAAVADLHPDLKRDVSIFGSHGLLTRKTVMAHGIHLDDSEFAVMADRGSGIAHCPLANFLVNGDGILRVKAALKAGVNVGLGTDIAGGYRPTMLSAIRISVLASKMLGSLLNDMHKEFLSDPGTEGKSTYKDTFAKQAVATLGKEDVTLTFRDGFWLATMGGALCLNLQDDIGTFDTDKYFDAVLVDVGRADVFDVFESDSPMDRFQKFINLGDDRNICKVYVAGSECSVSS